MSDYYKTWEAEKKKFQGAAPSLKHALKGTEMRPVIEAFDKAMAAARKNLKAAIDDEKNMARAMAAERKELEGAIKDVEERVANAKKLGGVDNINFEGSDLRKSFGKAIEGIITAMTREMDDLTKG
jgi:hypothetical protein